MLKAYRELEHEGLVAARPGVGTFVTRSLADASLAAHGPLRRDLQRWLAKARPAGLDDESIEALFATRFGREHGGRSVTAVLRADGLGKRYRRRWALPDCTLEIPAGRVIGLVGPNGAGKTHPAQPGGRPARARRRARSRCCGGRPRGDAGAAGQGRLRRPGHADLPGLTRRRPPEARRAAQPAVGRRAWRAAGSSSSASTRRQRAGKLSGGQRAQLALTLGPRQAARAARSSTSRSPASTRWPGGSSCRT